MTGFTHVQEYSGRNKTRGTGQFGVKEAIDV